MTTRFGFKKLTLDNWLEPAKPSTIWVHLAPDGTTHATEGNDWVCSILKPELAETVPDEVQRLFEVARAALAYGYFFYPLYTLGAEQLFRVAEAAVTHKCKAIGAQCDKWPFRKKVKHMIEQQVIPEGERIRWNAIVGIRNTSSHPDHQSLTHTPTDAIRTLEIIADQINAMFTS